MINAASAERRHHARMLAAMFVIFLPLAAALAVSFAVTPEQIERGEVVLTPTCSFKRIFGRPCPTCGLTRAFCALSHGRLNEGIGHHRASPIVYGLWWLGTLTAGMFVIRAARRRLLAQWKATS